MGRQEVGRAGDEDAKEKEKEAMAVGNCRQVHAGWPVNYLLLGWAGLGCGMIRYVPTYLPTH